MLVIGKQRGGFGGKEEGEEVEEDEEEEGEKRKEEWSPLNALDTDVLGAERER